MSLLFKTWEKSFTDCCLEIIKPSFSNICLSFLRLYVSSFCEIDLVFSFFSYTVLNKFEFKKIFHQIQRFFQQKIRTRISLSNSKNPILTSNSQALAFTSEQKKLQILFCKRQGAPFQNYEIEENSCVIILLTNSRRDK